MTGGGRAEREVVEVKSLRELRHWLEQHHASSVGAWIVSGKKGTDSYIAYPDLVREALRVGWIDSQPRSVDEYRTSRLLTPRKPGSGWSRVNKQHIARLEEAEDMHAAGTAAVAAAIADGSWHALDEVEALTEPPDLTHALDSEAAARAHWDAFPRSTRRAILEWISQARTASTRERRISQTVSEASMGRRANQWRQPN